MIVILPLSLIIGSAILITGLDIYFDRKLKKRKEKSHLERIERQRLLIRELRTHSLR